MKFGTPDNIPDEAIDLPPDYGVPGAITTSDVPFRAYVGLPKWNRDDVNNFYPAGTKAELPYYATQFNSIELNATFYRRFPDSNFNNWRDMVPDGFKFFPRLGQDISHFRRLRDFEELVDEDVKKFRLFEDHLGTIFIQLHNNFGTKSFKDLRKFVKNWKYDEQLAIEFRSAEWYSDPRVTDDLCALLEENKIGHTIIETAGRRDLVHMRRTTPWQYIRFVGCGVDHIDHRRLAAWAERIALWKSQGLREIDFVVHRHDRRGTAQLAAYFIEKLNAANGMNLPIPHLLKPKQSE